MTERIPEYRLGDRFIETGLGVTITHNGVTRKLIDDPVAEAAARAEVAADNARIRAARAKNEKA